MLPIPKLARTCTYNLYGTIAENFDKYDTYFYRVLRP